MTEYLLSEGATTLTSTPSSTIAIDHRTEAGTLLIVSAMHTLAERYLELGRYLIKERLGDPIENPRANRIFLGNDEGRSVDSLASVLSILYNLDVPLEKFNIRT